MKKKEYNKSDDFIWQYITALGIFLVIGITLISITAQTSQNLVIDSGFENNGLGWNKVGNGGRSITNIEAHSGSKSLQMLVSKTYQREVYQDIAITSGNTYDASGWIKTSGIGGGGSSIQILWLNTNITGDAPPSSIILTDTLGTILGMQNWTRFSGTFIAPANAVVARFMLYTSADPDGSGTAWFDDTDFSINAPQNDTTPPAVSITSPADGQTVAGIITVSANASDNVAVAGVQFQVDSVNIGVEDTTAPYSISLDTKTLSNGTYTLAAVARDISNNIQVSSSVMITVSNAPDTNNTTRHNIVLILTDDQRWDTMQYMPLTNSLIGDMGVNFSNAFMSTPLCCPSRSSILTGQYVHNHGVIGNYLSEGGGATKFNDTSTIATWLQSVGYRTGLYGKYLNDYQRLAPYVPPGWNEWHAFKNDPAYYNYVLVENGKQYTYKTGAENYSTNLLASKAIKFIENTTAGTPLFLYFTPYAPHTPATPAPGDGNLFSNLTPWRPPSYNETDVSDKPLWVRNLSPVSGSTATSKDNLRLNQIRSLQAVDRAVAGIVDALNRTGRLDNTVIIFTSDNGFSWGEHRYFKKNCVYEECIRAPLFVRAPGIVPRTDDHFIQNIDFAPTIAEWAGIVPPTKINGMSFVGMLSNTSIPWRTSMLFEVLGAVSSSSGKFYAVRTSQYIYAEYMNGDLEFYDLATDPYQLNNSVNNTIYNATITQLKSTLNTLKTA